MERISKSETPREYKRRIDAEWRKNEGNKDKLIKKIREYKLFEEWDRREIEAEILETFYKKEKESKGEEYENIVKLIEDVDKKYEILEQLREQLRSKEEEGEKKDDEIAKVKLEGPTVTALDQQRALREKLKKEREEIGLKIEEIKKEIADREEEIKDMEEVYWEKPDIEGIEEDEFIDEKVTPFDKTEKVKPRNLKEHHEQVIKELWGEDKVRWEIIEILEEWAWIWEELSKKIEREVSKKFFEYYDGKQRGLSMKVARRLKNKLKGRKDMYEEIKAMPEWDGKEEKLRNLEELEKAYWVEPLAEIDRKERQEREKREIERTKEMFAPYRKLREEKVRLDEKTKSKIIKVADKIPVKVNTDADGSRLIEFQIEDKIYKILDPILDNHTDSDYDYSHRVQDPDNITKIRRRQVYSVWMKWGLDGWANKPLSDYVKQKEKEWLHLAKIEEVESLLKTLWRMAGIDGTDAKVAMLAYLIGIDWWYWLFWEEDYPDTWILFKKNPKLCECDGWRLNLLMMDVTVV